MLKLNLELGLDKCPHCGVDKPSLVAMTQRSIPTKDVNGGNVRYWRVYSCSRCGGAVTASAANNAQQVLEYFPSNRKIDDELPARAKEYLRQAIDSISAPAGAVMLAASSVDSMLKSKGYENGSLYSRIKKAAEDGVITSDMEKWAHEVRLDANDQRHADDSSELPDSDDAKRVIDFVEAIGQFLFVLPARVQRGLDNAQES